MSVLGIDPDTKGTGLALTTSRHRDRGTVLALGCAFEHGHSPPRSEVRKTRGLVDQLERVEELILAMNSIAQEHDDPIDLVVVEGQQIYRKGRADPNGILRLGHVTGAALLVAGRLNAIPLLALPRLWKGQAKKEVTWERAMRWLRWEYERSATRFDFTIPTDVRLIGRISRGHRKEVLDAIAIAHWGQVNKGRWVK